MTEQGPLTRAIRAIRAIRAGLDTDPAHGAVVNPHLSVEQLHLRRAGRGPTL